MKERNCYVYEDYRIDNWTCCYVGMGSKNEEKGYDRFEVAERNEHHDNIMNSCGITRVIIRDNLTRKEANALEEARIYYYVFVLGYTIDIKGYIKGKKSDSHLTNQTWGGDGAKGCNPYANKSEEEMKEIAKKKSETWNNKTEEEMKEWKRKQTEAKGIFVIGINFKTNEIIELNSAKEGEKFGFMPQNITQCCKGKRKSHKGYKFYYKEGYLNLSKKQIEKDLEESRNAKNEANKKNGKTNSKKVRCIETNQIFNSLKQASEWCGLKSHMSIIQQIQKKKKSAGKHPITGEKLHWEYVIEEQETINLNLLTISNIKLNI